MPRAKTKVPPKFRRHARVTYRTHGSKGVTAPREGKVLGVRETARGYFVEVKDLETLNTISVRPKHIVLAA